MKRGFSLIELTVAILVMAIVAATAVHVAAHARMAAQRVGCISNMRQIGVATLAYAMDNNMDLPRTTHDRGTSWIFSLANYLGDVDEVRISPGDPRQRALIANDGTSYKVNEFLAVPLISPVGELLEPAMNNLALIPHPARTPFLFVGSERAAAVTATEDHTHSRRWTNWNRVRADIAPDRHRVGAPAADNTRGTSNYLFMDGRVENIPAGEMKRIIDSGINFARPPMD